MAGRRLARAQAEMDALWDEAAEDARLDPSLAQRENVLRMMYHAFNIVGTMNWPRGWIAAATEALEARGCSAPGSDALRWYRSTLFNDPLRLDRYAWADPEVVGDMLELSPH